MVASAISIRPRRTRGYEISLRQSMYTGLAQPDVKMYGFSALKCTACTSSSILAVVSEIVWRSKPVMGGSFGMSGGEAGAGPDGAASGVCRAMLGGIRGRLVWQTGFCCARGRLFYPEWGGPRG